MMSIEPEIVTEPVKIVQKSDRNIQKIVTYYEDTGLDYGEWSREYNMHFGYYRFWMNPFVRETMLNEMNHVVFEHLQLKEEDELIYDLGCGLAAPCRAFARKYPGKKIKGITIVMWQVEKAKELNKNAGLDSNIELVSGDYTKLPFSTGSADAVYALESCCHAKGLGKGDFVKEMMRVLKPGKRFVIVDGFIRKEPESFRGLLRYCYNEVIKGWALPSFPHIGLFAEEIKKAGGNEIEIKDFSFRIAPSAFHSPFAVVYFLLKKIIQGEKLNKVRLGHLKSCLLGLILGMFRHRFSYCLITGIKKI
ncbi:MAG TPA: methyltransferase domain-containing protein [Ignavibacteria bacterium]|jgi:ubiquinone/menaquinone biosynthesis C-methylase UbiE